MKVDRIRVLSRECRTVSMEAVEEECPAEHRVWVERLRHGGPTPLSLKQASPNSWTFAPPDAFSVRGPDYMTSKTKIPAGLCLLHPLSVEFLQGPSQISHIMQHPDNRVRAALDSAILHSPHTQPFVWCFNIQLGNQTHHSLVYYFASFHPPPQGSLMQQFLDGNDAFRNSRLKLLTRFPEAPWLVQVVVGERWPVCMLGKIMKCTYMREKHYIEVDVDAATSMLTRTAVKLTFGLTPLVISDFAFVLEGICPDELPERMLGAIRIVKLEPSSALYIGMPEVKAMPKDVKATFMKFSRSTSKDPRAGFKYKRPAKGEEKNKGGEE